MSKELEYIQRHINIVKQQIKGSKVKFIVTVTDAVAKYQYDYYENELQTLESIEKSLKRLEAIDNANPSEALQTLMDYSSDYVYERNNEFDIRELEEASEILKQALIQAEQDKKKLNKIEKLTHLLYSERRKIGQEYVKWCKENNTVFNDETNMITWVLAIKLKEVVEE